MLGSKSANSTKSTPKSGHTSDSDLILDMEKLTVNPQVEEDPRPKGEQLLHYLIEIILHIDSQ